MSLKKLVSAIRNFLGFSRKPTKIIENSKEVTTSNTEDIVVVPPVIQDQQVKEVGWFNRKNNLIQEFVGSAPIISSSKFGSYDEETGKSFDYYGKEIEKIPEEWRYIRIYKNFVVISTTSLADIQAKIERIDRGDTFGFITIVEYQEKYGLLESTIILNEHDDEEEDTFDRDLKMLEDRGLVVSKPLPQGNTYIISPNKEKED